MAVMDGIDLRRLPDDTKKLKAIVRRLAEERARLARDHDHRDEEHRRALEEQRQAYEQLQEKFRVLHRLYFGRSSERRSEEDHRQALLFNEAEDGAEELSSFTDEQAASVLIPEHRRKRPGRKGISKDLPREVVVHDLSEEEKRCPCCGEQRPLIGEETTEEVDIIPAQVKVLRHVRPVYGPCDCAASSMSSTARSRSHGAISLPRRPPRSRPLFFSTR